ncbi:hypothetical protein KKD87_00790 [bacterium]|nr:hypothetical protein [bacterium]MBU1781894.1 hypothetical protein [bacterium]
MEIVLNGRNLDFELEDEKTLGDVLLVIGKWTAEVNAEVITKIKINTDEVILPAEGFDSKKPIEEIKKLELETKRVATKDLLAELASFKDKLNLLTKDLIDVAVKLQTGNDLKAMEAFQDDITILEDLITLTHNSGRCFNLNYSQIKVNEKTVEEEILALKDLLKEVIMAFENKDMVMLCDLLEYELSPLMEGWLDLIDRLKEETKARLN